MYLQQLKSSDIQKETPIFVTSARELKTALEKLRELDFIQYAWDKGDIDIQYNIEKFKDFFTIEDVIVQKETAKKTTRINNNYTPEILEIKDYYQSLKTLPEIKTITPRRLLAIQNALQRFSIDEIKNAMLFASKQEWLIKRSQEQWCDMAWILERIEDFMDGGKYKKKEKIELLPKKPLNVFL